MRKSKSGNEFVTKDIRIIEAIQEINEQIFQGIISRQFHPLGIIPFIFFGKYYSLTPFTLQCKKNCKSLLNFINAYVQKRKSGAIKSKVVDNTDLLSLFLSTPEVFTDDFIIDELMDFFFAAV